VDAIFHQTLVNLLVMELCGLWIEIHVDPGVELLFPFSSTTILFLLASLTAPDLPPSVISKEEG